MCKSIQIRPWKENRVLCATCMYHYYVAHRHETSHTHSSRLLVELAIERALGLKKLCNWRMGASVILHSNLMNSIQYICMSVDNNLLIAIRIKERREKKK